MYLLLKRERGAGAQEEGRVGQRGGVRLDRLCVSECCVCAHTGQLLSFISRSTGCIFSFLLSLRQRPRRQADLSHWCKWSVNTTRWHWWYWTAPRWMEECECATLTTILLPCCYEECILSPLFWLKATVTASSKANTEDEFLFRFCTAKRKFSLLQKKDQRSTWDTPTWHSKEIEKCPKYIHVTDLPIAGVCCCPWQDNSLPSRSSTDSKEEKVHKCLILYSQWMIAEFTQVIVKALTVKSK